jgi:uroporphyrinogen-III synthase
MQLNKKILSTRPIDASLVETARTKGVQLDSLSFIETAAIQTIEVQQEIELAAIEITTVVFTSMNAVEAVTTALDGMVPEWRIYCMGQRTQELVVEYFGKNAVAGTASSASLLADEITNAEEEIDSVIFFCGNIRRNELPLQLQANGIEVQEIVVYETITRPHQLTEEYDGVLFFSPSAADSFFQKNKLPAHTVVFAIGDTTASAVKKYSNNQIITATEPGKDALAMQAIRYFTSLETTG